VVSGIVYLTADIFFDASRIGGGLCGVVGGHEAPLEVGLEDRDDFVVADKHERASDGAKYVG